MTMRILLNSLAALLISSALMPAAYAKAAPAAKHPNAAEQSTPTAAKTDKKKVSYGVGVDIGRNFQQLGLDLNLDALLKGMNDAYNDKKLDIAEDELRQLVTAYRNEMMQKQVAVMQAKAASNQKDGEAFLAANAKKDGVVTLPSGLQYKILKQGDGKKPGINDKVTCNYRGTLIDGTEFDAGKAAQFKLGGVIPGWKEALQLMPGGSKWQLFIPPQLAYGQRGAGRDIGPNATLVFEVELVGIESDETKKATP